MKYFKLPYFTCIIFPMMGIKKLRMRKMDAADAYQ